MIGVCVLPAPPPNAARTVSYPHYIHEVLAHAGLCYETVRWEQLSERLPGLRLLVTVGETALPDALLKQLSDWVAAGGAWIGVGGICGATELFGAEAEPPAYSSWGGGVGTLGEGYLAAENRTHPCLAHLALPLHYFNGIPAQPKGGTVLARALDAHQRESARAAVIENAVGQGCCLLIAPDITGTLVRIQQGIAVTRDGISAPDGTAPIADDVLKSGDGGVLDWIFDRRPVPGVPGFRAFLEPIADQWRELLLRAILTLASRQQVTVPLLWLYPRNLPAVGHLSHDTDGNDPNPARQLLAALESANVRSTWCVILPGYDAELLSAIRDAGHELATHYDAMSEGTIWSETEFDAQWRALTALFGEPPPVSNKNHYLRWEGDTEFFQWCAKRGIQLDQSKGASKTGEAGFNFGTCRPYFPVAPDGRLLDVLELPTPTQDLIVFAPRDLLEPLLAAVERHHGVLHLLFHPAHANKPGVLEAMREAVDAARRRGMEWWTARQLNAWERARRQIQWRDCRQAETGVRVHLRAETPLAQPTLLCLTPKAMTITVNGEVAESVKTERWGFGFQAVTMERIGPEGITMEAKERKK